MDNRPDLSLAEVARLTGQSIKTIRYAQESGQFPHAYRAGKGQPNSAWRIPQADVDNYRKPRAV